MKYYVLAKPYYCLSHHRGKYTYITVFSSDCFLPRDHIVFLVVSTKFYNTGLWKDRLNTYLINKKPNTSCKPPTDAVYA
jgi:hypothetical protein